MWENLIRRALSMPTHPLSFEKRRPVGRITISSPAVLEPLSGLNDGRQYAEQLKPFNFLLTCHVRPFGHPTGADPERFHLIAPYQTDARQWTDMDWIDQYSGAAYRITTRGHHGDVGTVRVKTYGEVLDEYEWHPESKCADAAGQPSTKRTVGLLQRRHIQISSIRFIGKESNHLEAVEAGLMHAAEAVYTEYPDPRHDDWLRVRDALHKIPLKTFEERTGKSRRMLIDARRGRRRPHLRTRQILLNVARELGVLV